MLKSKIYSENIQPSFQDRTINQKLSSSFEMTATMFHHVQQFLCSAPVLSTSHSGAIYASPNHGSRPTSRHSQNHSTTLCLPPRFYDFVYYLYFTGAVEVDFLDQRIALLTKSPQHPHSYFQGSFQKLLELLASVGED